jgi:hypothetical protein
VNRVSGLLSRSASGPSWSQPERRQASPHSPVHCSPFTVHCCCPPLPQRARIRSNADRPSDGRDGPTVRWSRRLNNRPSAIANRQSSWSPIPPFCHSHPNRSSITPSVRTATGRALARVKSRRAASYRSASGKDMERGECRVGRWRSRSRPAAPPCRWRQPTTGWRCSVDAGGAGRDLRGGMVPAYLDRRAARDAARHGARGHAGARPGGGRRVGPRADVAQFPPRRRHT